MAIKSYDLNDKIDLVVSRNSSKEKTCHLFSQSCATNSSTSSLYKKEKRKLEEHETHLSSYFSNNKLRILSSGIEKRFIEKKATDYMSSLPLAANIYKANSDEFKSTKRINRKNKKSVLTLPNQSTPDAQICTVSDMNDSEYSGTNVNCRPRLKRAVANNVRRPRTKNREIGINDTDTQNLSKLNSSSTNIIKRCKGDSKTTSNNNAKNDFKSSCLPASIDDKHSMKLHDVWSVLRNLNRFQFTPSPPMSDESNFIPKKKKMPNKRINRKDTRVVETCQIEEIAYISSYKVNESSLSLSQSSSFDRITVINKKDECSKICTELDDNPFRKRFSKNANKNELEGRKKIQKRTFKTGTVKTLSQFESEEKHSNLIQKHCSNVKTKKSNSDLEDSQDKYNIVSPLLNSNGLQNMQSSPVAAVTNTKKCGMEYNLDLVDYYNNFSDNSKKMNISKNQLKSQKHVSSANNELPQAKEITKVITKFGKESILSTIKPHQHETQKRDSQLATTILSACMLPKFTQTDIDTFDKQKKENKDVVNQRNIKNNTYNFSFDYNSNKVIKSNYEVVKHIRHKAKQMVNNNFDTIKNKLEIKRSAISSNTVIKEKQKPLTQLKDKMLNLLHKKVSDKSLYEEYNEKLISRGAYNTKMKVETCTETQNISSISKNNLKSKKHESSVIFLNKRSKSEFKYPWAKAKWASDCIENVIEKIKSGVYFNEDNKYINRISEVSIQTELISNQGNFSALNYVPSKVAINKKKDIAQIPGFDNSLFGLKIQTLNMKEITVKHCSTNVMIQFDITIPNDINKIAVRPKSCSIEMPVEVSENRTRLFKSNKSILNSMLPAEVCSIIPRMINAIDPSYKSSMHAYCTELIHKTVSNMSTISEMSRNEFTLAITDSNKSFTPLVLNVSPFINNILQGLFSITYYKCPNKISKVAPKVNCGTILITDLLPKTCFFSDIVQLPLTITTYQLVPFNPIENEITIQTHSLGKLKNPYSTCTALEVYSVKNKRLIKAFKAYDTEYTLRNIFWNLVLRFIGQIQCIGTTRCFFMNINGCVTNLRNDSQVSKDINTHDKHLIKSIEHHKRSIKNNCEGTDQKSKKGIKLTNKHKKLTNKYKRRVFYKLYRKCKSMTNILCTEKSVNAPLNKIQNIEDFFQILSSQQGLSSVFDGHVAKKILSAIVEMKNWITDINPRQALLILLLTNKKDTPNLVRFRPILLQGIAVNRITRATELDMEIEVIERENLNKLPQCEGISYLPGSIENQDQLLEELYWIAKTTASDYQRPFDESSEILLKSLLEKRKKLNPSYLRVMARYVGLGLLKTPTRK